jgi:hypothetical protein
MKTISHEEFCLLSIEEQDNFTGIVKRNGDDYTTVYKNGQLHNENGPAYIVCDGIEEYYLNGKHISSCKEYMLILKQLAFLVYGGKYHITESKDGFHVKVEFDLLNVGRRYEGESKGKNLNKAKTKAFQNMLEHRIKHLNSANKNGISYKDPFHDCWEKKQHK